MRNRHPGPTPFIQQTPNLTCQFRRKQVSSLPAPEPRVAGGPRVRILLPPAASPLQTRRSGAHSGDDRRGANIASELSDGGPRVRIHLPPPVSQLRTGLPPLQSSAG